MSVLRAGNTTLEDGKVRICVPIAYETEKEHYAIIHPRLSRDFSFHFAVGLPF